MKICNKCHISKELSEFYTSKRYKDGLRYSCKECDKMGAKTWAQRNPEKSAQLAKEYRLKNPEIFKATNQRTKLRLLYGITPAEYNEMLNNQNGVCFICNNKESVFRNGKTYDLSVDHCHETQLNRGLLCRNCNTALGMLKDNPKLLRKAADYIEFHKERHERIIMEEKQNLEVAVPLTELVSTP